jgi:hypothetical protein
LRPSFAKLRASRSWRPIRNCPGRFSLATDNPRLPISAMVGDGRVERFEVASARDPVLVVPLADGGLISYARSDGTITHTLNTPAGFQRKLRQLGITLPAELSDAVAARSGE